MPIPERLGLYGKRQPMQQVIDALRLLMRPFQPFVGDEQIFTQGVELVPVSFLIARGAEMQISMPLASASSAIICITGFASPSRSTIGSIAFCTVSAVGYKRTPRPAAVITALLICIAESLFLLLLLLLFLLLLLLTRLSRNQNRSLLQHHLRELRRDVLASCGPG